MNVFYVQKTAFRVQNALLSVPLSGHYSLKPLTNRSLMMSSSGGIRYQQISPYHSLRLFHSP